MTQPGLLVSGGAGNSYQDAIFRQAPEDGIEFLPSSPGVYAMLNRISNKWYVGQAKNILNRCISHRSELRRGIGSNMLMRRDAELNGIDAFFLVLYLADAAEPRRPSMIDMMEVWWVIQLRAHDERWGYNLEAGHRRTTGALFRDRERKLMRSRSGKYELLDGVHMYDPIHPDLLGSWVRGS